MSFEERQKFRGHIVPLPSQRTFTMTTKQALNRGEKSEVFHPGAIRLAVEWLRFVVPIIRSPFRFYDGT